MVMNIREATSFRIAELCRQKNLSGYSVSYRAGMPSSTYKSIINGKSKNPGIVNINKIADGIKENRGLYILCFLYVLFIVISYKNNNKNRRIFGSIILKYILTII